MPLSDITIRNAKPGEKPMKLADEKGLFLLVQPNGAKYWRHKYRFDGKEKTLAHGVYPEVSLKDARERRDAARKLLAQGTDPSEIKQIAKQGRIIAASNSFEAIARAWFIKYMGGTRKGITVTPAQAQYLLDGLTKAVQRLGSEGVLKRAEL